MVTLPCQETHFNALMLSMEFVRKLTGLKYENFVLLIGSIPSTVVLTVFNKRIAKGSLYNLKIVIDICLAGHSGHLSRHCDNSTISTWLKKWSMVRWRETEMGSMSIA